MHRCCSKFATFSFIHEIVDAYPSDRYLLKILFLYLLAFIAVIATAMFFFFNLFVFILNWIIFIYFSNLVVQLIWSLLILLLNFDDFIILGLWTNHPKWKFCLILHVTTFFIKLKLIIWTANTAWLWTGITTTIRQVLRIAS